MIIHWIIFTEYYSVNIIQTTFIRLFRFFFCPSKSISVFVSSVCLAHRPFGSVAPNGSSKLLVVTSFWLQAVCNTGCLQSRFCMAYTQCIVYTVYNVYCQSTRIISARLLNRSNKWWSLSLPGKNKRIFNLQLPFMWMIPIKHCLELPKRISCAQPVEQTVIRIQFLKCFLDLWVLKFRMQIFCIYLFVIQMNSKLDAGQMTNFKFGSQQVVVS